MVGTCTEGGASVNGFERTELSMLRRAQRLQRLVNQEGNGMRVDFFTLLQPSGEDTPAVDVDETPSDLDKDEVDDNGNS